MADSPISVSADRPEQLSKEQRAELNDANRPHAQRKIVAVPISPAENSELRDAFVDLTMAYHERNKEAFDITCQCIEELFASLQRTHDFEKKCVNKRVDVEIRELQAEISRWRADRLTREDAVWLLDYLNDNKYAAHHDHVSPVFAKLRRISGLGSQ